MEEMTTLREKLQRVEGYKLDTLSEVMELASEQVKEVRVTFSEEGAEILMWGTNIELEEEFEAEKAENQEIYKDTPSDEA